MKATSFLTSTLLIIGLFAKTAYCKITVIGIQKAFEKKQITAKAICKGGLSLDYSVCNLLKDSIRVIIPAGWRFNSNDIKNDYQDILLTHTEILVLRPKETKKFNITGYCCEATKSGPIAGINYTQGKLADSNLVQLARYLSAHPFDKNAEQYSVWAISNNQETAHITSKNDSTAAILRAFVTKLKNEPLPWYTLLKRANISTLGTVSDKPVKFKATINYLIDKTCYSYCYIIDNKGNKVSEIFGQWLTPEADSNYNAMINVSHLNKGEYTLILENNESAIFQKSFKI